MALPEGNVRRLHLLVTLHTSAEIYPRVESSATESCATMVKACDSAEDYCSQADGSALAKDDTMTLSDLITVQCTMHPWRITWVGSRYHGV